MRDSEFSGTVEAIEFLRTPATIRHQCQRLFNLACDDQLRYFRVDLSVLDRVAQYVLEVTQEQYPDLQIPFHSRWRHFEVGNVSRLGELEAVLTDLPQLEQVKVKFDLAMISVLLDAGAGATWQYCEPETGQVYCRSEGLAVASFRMFCQGIFSSNPEFPWQADATKLASLELSELATGFQVTSENPLVGLTGRLNLLQKLGQVLTQYPEYFGTEPQRPGNLASYFVNSCQSDQRLKATAVLKVILDSLGDIWPGRYAVAGVNLGDVWPHPALESEPVINQFVPFHKLSQWLTYSLLEPLQEIGLEIVGLNELTGLPEYRNGGLCLDTGLLQLKSLEVLQKKHLPSSEIIVEWRALTVILLDKIAEQIRQKLSQTAVELPLVKVLQGGTWTAGRRLAAQLRTGGIPPLQIESDGTVF